MLEFKAGAVDGMIVRNFRGGKGAVVNADGVDCADERALDAELGSVAVCSDVETAIPVVVGRAAAKRGCDEFRVAIDPHAFSRMRSDNPRNFRADGIDVAFNLERICEVVAMVEGCRRVHPNAESARIHAAERHIVARNIIDMVHDFKCKVRGHSKKRAGAKRVFSAVKHGRIVAPHGTAVPFGVVSVSCEIVPCRGIGGMLSQPDVPDSVVHRDESILNVGVSNDERCFLCDDHSLKFRV